MIMMTMIMMIMVAQHIPICHAMLAQKISQHDGILSVLMGICQCDPKIIMTSLMRLPWRFPPPLAPSLLLVQQQQLP